MTNRLRFTAHVFFIITLVLCWTSSGLADTFVVTNTNDSGAGSLRQALLDANTNVGADTIVFNIPDGVDGHEADPGVWRIQPTSSLPLLADDSTLIDGTSQADFIGGDPNTDGPEIVLDGRNYTSGNGFYISGSNCAVMCLCINRFDANQIYVTGDSNSVKGCYIGPDATGLNRVDNEGRGIYLDGGSYNVIGGVIEQERNIISGNSRSGISMISYANQNRISGNYIGINSTGSDTMGNWHGIGVSTYCKRNIIGPGNVISGNKYNGISMEETGTDSNSVIGNFIGTDPGGELDWGNQEDGVSIMMRASYNVIGGSLPEDRNIISGNDGYGIRIEDSGTDSNSVLGNYIGTDITGTEALSNSKSGIWIAYGIKYNQIGGTNEGERNLISGNSYWGINMIGEMAERNQIVGNIIGADISGTTALANGYGGISISSSAHDNIVGPDNIIAFNGGVGVEVYWEGTINNTITRNSIFSNQGLGIDNAGGGNHEIDPPVITMVGSVSGTAIPNSRVEIFSGPDEEGKTYEDSVFADASGNFTWAGTPVGPYVTATATDELGNTSEFSDSVLVTSVEVVNSVIPERFSLVQNYPNPFNPETTIRFGVMKPCRVILKVYDLLGREVAKIVDKQTQPGVYEITFDATGLSSGLYFYRIQMGDFQAVKKMVVLE